MGNRGHFVRCVGWNILVDPARRRRIYQRTRIAIPDRVVTVDVSPKTDVPVGGCVTATDIYPDQKNDQARQDRSDGDRSVK